MYKAWLFYPRCGKRGNPAVLMSWGYMQAYYQVFNGMAVSHYPVNACLLPQMIKFTFSRKPIFIMSTRSIPCYTFLRSLLQQSGSTVLLVLALAVHAMAQSRTVESFNTGWQFFKVNNSTFFADFDNGAKYFDAQNQWTAPEVWENVTLPHTWNSEDMQKDRNFFEGKGIYRKTFSVDPDGKDRQRLFLKFEGVGAVAKVYINNNYIGEHKGAFGQFVFEITNSVQYGKENTVVVIADNKSRRDVIPINHFLFPVYGGIYRPVHLITTQKTGFVVTDNASPGLFIRQENVSAAGAGVQVKAKLETKEKTAQNADLLIEIKDHTGRTVAGQKKAVRIAAQGVTYVNETLTLKNPRLWDGVRDPYLYSLSARLVSGSRVLDEVVQPLGLRTVEVIPGKGFFLNGRHYPMYGVCRHQDLRGKGSALSFEDHRRDLQMIREMGATTIRFAHYQQSPDVYALADSIGFLVWAEIPFVNRVSYYENDNAKQQLTELVKQNFNHPSIYVWGMHNEVYAATADEQVPVLTRELNDIAKTLDPDRMTVAVSGYNQVDRQENLNTDIQGINHYFGWYGGKIEDLEPWARSVRKDFPEYKIILSEYGADGNRDIGREEVRMPDNVVRGQSFPENYQTETHIQQWAIIEKNPIIAASYAWCMFEFAVPAWNRGGVNARNLKGLVTFDRRQKKDAFYWYKANWNPEPMVYLANRRDNQRTNPVTRIQLFSNVKDVQLLVNGKPCVLKQGVNDKHRVAENVELQKGTNRIEARAKNGAEILTDEMTWELN